MKQAKISLEYLPIELRNTVVGAPHSQNPFEHQQRRRKFYETGEDRFGILTHWVA
jgi:hypothetical protein